MTSIRHIAVLILVSAMLVGGLPGCQTLKQLAALRHVGFAIDRVSDVALADVSLAQVSAPADLSASEAAYLVRTLAQGEAPLSLTLHLDAHNPAENEVSARLMAMDWTLLLDGTETVSGTFEKNILLPPGKTKDFALDIRLDLFRFFDRSAQDLVELALAVAGVGDAATAVELRATPLIDTPVGRLRYPEPITITLEEVGG